MKGLKDTLALNLVSMKNKEKKKDTANQPICCTENEEYPYGTRISLEEDSIDKLGIDFESLKVNAFTCFIFFCYFHTTTF